MYVNKMHIHIILHLWEAVTCTEVGSNHRYITLVLYIYDQTAFWRSDVLFRIINRPQGFLLLRLPPGASYNHFSRLRQLFFPHRHYEVCPVSTLSNVQTQNSQDSSVVLLKNSKHPLQLERPHQCKNSIKRIRIARRKLSEDQR